MKRKKTDKIRKLVEQWVDEIIDTHGQTRKAVYQAYLTGIVDGSCDQQLAEEVMKLLSNDKD